MIGMRRLGERWEGGPRSRGSGRDPRDISRPSFTSYFLLFYVLCPDRGPTLLYLGPESCRLGPRHKAGQKAAPSWVIHLYARVCSCLPSPCTSRVAGLRPPTRREGKIEVQMTGKRAEPYLRPSSRRIAICVAFVTPATFSPTPAWAPCHVSTQ